MQAPTLVLSGTFRLSEGGQRLTMGKFNELVRDNAALNIDVCDAAFAAGRPIKERRSRRPLLALSRHLLLRWTCLLSGVKRT